MGSSPYKFSIFLESCVTREGAMCVFPFNYNGSPQNKCIREDYDKFWCATATNENGDIVTDQWGVCSVSCDVSEDCDSDQIRGPRGGIVSSFALTPGGRWKQQPKKCVFPFNYNGSTRHYCIREGAMELFGRREPWCATETDENGDVTEYGICSISCDTGE